MQEPLFTNVDGSESTEAGVCITKQAECSQSLWIEKYQDHHKARKTLTGYLKASMS